MSAIVVGGGLAGLLAGYRLAQAGNKVTLLEAGSELGGMLRSIEVGGITVDAGAEAYALRGGYGRALCDELGMLVASPLGRPHVFFPEGPFPMAEGLLGIPASADDPAFNALSEQGRQRAFQDLELPAEVGADATTVGELVAARMGEEAVERLVGPVATSIYGSTPQRLRLAEFAPNLLPALAEHGSLIAAVAATRSPSGAAVEQPVGGMFKLIEELAQRLQQAGGTIVCEAAVQDLTRDEYGFTVGLADGEQYQAQQIVLAAPAAICLELLGRLTDLDLELPAARQARLVTLAVDHPQLLDGPVGSGALVATPEGEAAVKAITHYSLKWPWAQRDGRSVLRLSYPGQADPDRAQAIADAARLTGVDITDDQVVDYVSVRWDAMPSRLDPAVKDQILQASAAAGVDVVGAWLDGNGIGSVIAGCQRVTA